jgi:hypothetical protein
MTPVPEYYQQDVALYVVQVEEKLEGVDLAQLPATFSMTIPNHDAFPLALVCSLVFTDMFVSSRFEDMQIWECDFYDQEGVHPIEITVHTTNSHPRRDDAKLEMALNFWDLKSSPYVL